MTITLQPKHIYRVWYSLNLHMCSSKMIVKTGPAKTAPARLLGMSIHLTTFTCKLLDLGRLQLLSHLGLFTGFLESVMYTK